MNEQAKKYKSSVLAAVHGMMSDLHEAGVVNKETMQHFDKSCLADSGEEGVDGWPEAGASHPDPV